MCRVNFKKILLVVAVFLISGCAKDNDGKLPVVSVGDSVITKAEFEGEIYKYIDDDITITKDEFYNLKKHLLEQLIEEYLIIEDAKKRGVKVTVQELDEEITRLRENEEISNENNNENEISEVDMNQQSAWREAVRRRLIINKVEEQVVNSAVTVTDKEVLKYYEQNISEFKRAKSVHLFMIVLSSEEEAKDIRSKITLKNFSEMAEKYSIGNEKETGGDLGYVTQGDMPPEIEDSAFILGVKRISSVIKSPYGYHILLVKSKKRASTKKFSDVKSKIKEQIKMEKADKLFTKWLYELKQETRIELYEENL